MKTGETLDKLTLSNTGNNHSTVSPYTKDVVCATKCPFRYSFNQVANQVTVKGTMALKDYQNNLVTYGLPETDEQVSVIYTDGNTEKVSYSNVGDFGFQMYAYPAIT